MAAIPSLYLKWRAFRELVGGRKADAMLVFDDHSGSFRFSKLLRGDIRCTPEIARKVVQVMNSRLIEYRAAKGLSEPASLLHGSDLDLPVYPFVRRLLATAEAVGEDELARVHGALLDEVAIRSESPAAQLVVERYAKTRAFRPFVRSGAPAHPVFEIGKDKGQLVVTGAPTAPHAAYAMLVRDPAPLGRRLWDMDWGETVFWLPSPFVPTRSDDRLLLLAEPEPVLPLPGRFIVTATLVWNEEAVGKLDPRGSKPPSGGVFDENDTTRFLTNLRRLQADKHKKWQGAVTVASAEYIVEG